MPIFRSKDNGNPLANSISLPPEPQLYLVLIITVMLSFGYAGWLYDLMGKGSYIIAEALLVLPGICYLLWKKLPLKEILRLNWISPRILLMSFCLGIGMVVVSDEIDRLVNLIYPMPEVISDRISRGLVISNWKDLLIVGTGVIIVAGIAEEALFRGFLQKPLEHYRGVTRAVTSASLLFALVHLNPWWIIQILILSMLLGVLAWRTNSILPGVVVHSINNGMGLFSANYPMENIAYYTYKGHISPIILACAGFVLYYSMKQIYYRTEHLHLQNEPPRENPSQGNPLSGGHE